MNTGIRGPAASSASAAAQETGSTASAMAAGTTATFVAYSPVDPCCHRLAPDAPFVDWLADASDQLDKTIIVSIDPDNRRHGLSTQQFDDLDAFLADLTG